MMESCGRCDENARRSNCRLSVSPRSAVVPPQGAWCGATSRAAGRRQRPPALRRNTSARERVACVSSGPGVAAQAVTWSPSYSRSFFRSPERFGRVGSHRPSTAARAPEAAIPRRRCSAACLPSESIAFDGGGPLRRAGRPSVFNPFISNAAAAASLCLMVRFEERFVGTNRSVRILASESQEAESTRKEKVRRMPSRGPANAELFR